MNNLVAFAGHRVHIVRNREFSTLLGWVGDRLAGAQVLDVAGGDGYWAGQIGRLGARAISLDIDEKKLKRGSNLSRAPALTLADALVLPFRDESFDVVMSICSLEHFADGQTATNEMARVLRPGGSLVLTADALTKGRRWPDLERRHRDRYSVHTTYDHSQLAVLFEQAGMEILDHTYMFRSPLSQRLYLGISRFRFGWNLAAPLSLAVRLSDRRFSDAGGSVVAVHAQKPPTYNRNADGDHGARKTSSDPKTPA